MKTLLAIALIAMCTVASAERVGTIRYYSNDGRSLGRATIGIRGGGPYRSASMNLLKRDPEFFCKHTGGRYPGTEKICKDMFGIVAPPRQPLPQGNK